MGTLKTNLIEPEGATTTLTVGEAGGNTVIGADSLKANTLKRRTNIVTTTFTSSGNFVIPAGGATADILIVAGGGGGSGGRADSRGGGSGGGGGGFLEGSNIALNAGTYTVTIGAGGAGGNTSAPGNGTAGSNSVITESTWGTATALGGAEGTNANDSAESGGSGGGGSAWGNQGEHLSNTEGGGGLATQGDSNGLTGYGFNGGFGYWNNPAAKGAGGGGGGAGGVGGNAINENNARDGGPGRGSTLRDGLFAGGGWGAAQSQGGAGEAAYNNTGDGGNAGRAGSNAGGAGGSGIVVVKYTLANSPQTMFVSNGSGTVSSVDSGWGGTQTLIQSQTITNGALMEFTSGIDSTYQEYMFEFLNVHPVTNNNINFEWQANASGQSGYNERMDSTFFVAQLRNNNSSAALQYDASGDRANETTYQPMALGIGNLLKESGSGELHIFNPASTTYTKQWYGKMHIYHASDYSINNYSAGYINTTAAITQISFQFNTGNFSGTIKMYGIQ